MDLETKGRTILRMTSRQSKTEKQLRGVVLLAVEGNVTLRVEQYQEMIHQARLEAAGAQGCHPGAAATRKVRSKRPGAMMLPRLSSDACCLRPSER